jgi:hypothetical protein
MRSKLLAGCILLSTLSWANERPDKVRLAPAERPSGADETEGAEVSDGAERRSPRGDGTENSHTVVKGDTLWDLSEKYLGSPWQWPKVWSYNPEIANPHWIYPGNLVRLSTDGSAPIRSDGSDSLNAGDDGRESPDAEAPWDSGTGTSSDSVEVVGQIGAPNVPQSRVARMGFVTPRELEESGRIEGAWAEAAMLSYPDIVYLSFKNKNEVQVGAEYVIFNTGTKVIHPITGSRHGYMTHILGAAKVLSVEGNLVRAQITQSFDAISRLDRVGPAGEKMLEGLVPRPNDRLLKGYVIATLEEVNLAAESHRVIIDKGSSDGIQLGNSFVVVRRGDQGEDLDPTQRSRVPSSQYPDEIVAKCTAIDVKDKATTCLITRSDREVIWGDRVEMRPLDSSGPLSQR